MLEFCIVLRETRQNICGVGGGDRIDLVIQLKAHHVAATTIFLVHIQFLMYDKVSFFARKNKQNSKPIRKTIMIKIKK